MVMSSGNMHVLSPALQNTGLLLCGTKQSNGEDRVSGVPAQSQRCLHSHRVIHKRGTMGKPDQKDLNENMAATQGLSHMITDCKKLFQVSGYGMSSPVLPFQDATSRRYGLTSRCWSYGISDEHPSISRAAATGQSAPAAKPSCIVGNCRLQAAGRMSREAVSILSCLGGMRSYGFLAAEHHSQNPHRFSLSF